MDDKNGKKAACWKKTRQLSPSIKDLVAKLEEVKSTLVEERETVLTAVEGAHSTSQESEEEDSELDVGTVNNG